MFLGFDSKSKAYRLFDQTRQKVVISWDVVFDETKVGTQHLNYYEPPSEVQIPFLKTGKLNSDPTEMIKLTEEPELDSVTICDSHSSDEQQHQRLATKTSSQSERIIRTATNEVIPPARRIKLRSYRNDRIDRRTRT